MRFRLQLTMTKVLVYTVIVLKSRLKKEVISNYLKHFNVLFPEQLIIIFFDFLVPEASPVNVRAIAMNSTAVQVWWTPPDPQKINGINQGYKLQAWIGKKNI
jgi:hypothetical protein